MTPAHLRRAARVLAGWWVLVAAVAAQAAPQRLSIAVLKAPHSAAVIVAQARGFFADEGLTVDLQPCALGRECLQQLFEGRAQWAVAPDLPVALAGFARRDFSIVATLAEGSRGDRSLIVRTDRGITAPAQLAGRRIGVVLGSTAHYALHSALLFHGVDPGSVTLVPLDAADSTGPLLRGEVDAACLFASQAAKAIKQLGPRGAALPIPSFVAARFQLLAAARASDDDTVRLLRALRRALDFIAANPVRAREMLLGQVPGDAAWLESAWPGVDFQLELTQALVTGLESQARWALGEKLVAAGLPVPDYLGLVRSPPLERVDRRAVRLVR